VCVYVRINMSICVYICGYVLYVHVYTYTVCGQQIRKLAFSSCTPGFLICIFSYLCVCKCVYIYQYMSVYVLYVHVYIFTKFNSTSENLLALSCAFGFCRFICSHQTKTFEMTHLCVCDMTHANG